MLNLVKAADLDKLLDQVHVETHLGERHDLHVSLIKVLLKDDLKDLK